MADIRKIINTVAQITSNPTIQHRVKSDGTDFYVSTLNCQTLEQYREYNAPFKPLEFWARIFYNPIAENHATTALNFKEILKKISTGEISAGSILYLSGVAERGGLFVKNPIVLIDKQEALKRNNSANIVGKIMSVNFDNNYIQLLDTVPNSKNEIMTLGLTPNVSDFFKSLLNKNTKLTDNSEFVFNAVNHGNFIYATEVQNVDHAYFVAKHIKMAPDEKQNVMSIKYNTEKNEKFLVR